MSFSCAGLAVAEGAVLGLGFFGVVTGCVTVAAAVLPLARFPDAAPGPPPSPRDTPMPMPTPRSASARAAVAAWYGSLERLRPRPASTTVGTGPGRTAVAASVAQDASRSAATSSRHVAGRSS